MPIPSCRGEAELGQRLLDEREMLRRGHLEPLPVMAQPAGALASIARS
jgi:hypothetical protein